MAAIDSVRLQEVVDKMAKRKEDGTWELDHAYAEQFFSLVNGYIQKSAYRSDRFDPENAASEVRWQLWRALEKYGPRPYGHPFANYTLKLKTNNVLTNLAKKRDSNKSKLNFVSESWDQMVEAATLEGKGRSKLPACLPLENLKERANLSLGKKRSVEALREVFECLSEAEKRKLFYLFLSSISGQKISEIKILCENIMGIAKTLNSILYNKSDDTEKKMIDLDTVRVGNKYVTKVGYKVIEIRGECEVVNEITELKEPGYKIFVPYTGKEIPVPTTYIQNSVLPYEEIQETVEKEKKPSKVIHSISKTVPVGSSEEPTKHIQTTEVEEIVDVKGKEDEETEEKSNSLRISSKDFLEKNLNTAKKEKKGEKMRKGTDHALVLELLRSGPQSRESLAKALIEADPKRSEEDMKKVKGWASVIVWNLVNKKGYKIVTAGKRGTYRLEEDSKESV